MTIYILQYSDINFKVPLEERRAVGKMRGSGQESKK